MLISIPEKKLIGNNQKMSLAVNKTGELWRNFLPRRNEIRNRVSDELYSLQVYPQNYHQNFNPTNEFIKWALLEVTNFDEVPDGMKTFILPGGQYAVFHYEGPANDPGIFNYIFTNWLPYSGFSLDNRPHFEILGDKYKNNGPDSEERYMDTGWVKGIKN